jgi:hypothetical protein
MTKLLGFKSKKSLEMLLRAPKNNGWATNFRAAQIFKLDYGQFVESWVPGNNYIMQKCGSSGGGVWEGWGSYVVGWIYTPSYLVWCL